MRCLLVALDASHTYYCKCASRAETLALLLNSELFIGLSFSCTSMFAVVAWSGLIIVNIMYVYNVDTTQLIIIMMMMMPYRKNFNRLYLKLM